MRAFTALPAPDAGLREAIVVGRRLRHRRQARTASLTGLAVVLAAATGAWLSASTRDAAEQLIPAGPGDAGAGVPAASARPGVTGPLAAAPRATAPARGTPVTHSAIGQPGGPGPSPAPLASAAGSSPSYRTPALQRDYAPPIPAGARLCSAQVSNDSSGTRKRIDWCVNAAAVLTDTGHDLTMTLCRDQSTDAALSFGTSGEVDLEVRRGGHVVWKWSRDHPESPGAHVLQTPAGACWSWTAPWTDVDSSGRDLPSGSYDLVALSRAQEVAELPEADATFRIG
jgi:hypothetical protein